jgi:sugar lactone lactonase YvrE
MYYIDSPKQSVQSFLFDRKSGNIQYEKDIIQIPRKMGCPDGMSMDKEGMLWIAHWGGLGVYRLNPGNEKCVDLFSSRAPCKFMCICRR